MRRATWWIRTPLMLMRTRDRQATPRKVVVATHGHCFDGMCSAVMFTRLYRQRFPGRRRDVHVPRAPATAPGRTASIRRSSTATSTPSSTSASARSPKLDLVLRSPRERVRHAGGPRGYERRAADSEERGERRFFHDGAYSIAHQAHRRRRRARASGSIPAPLGGARALGGHDRQRGVPEREDGGRARRAGAAADDGRRAPGRRRVPRADGAAPARASRSPRSRARRTSRRRTSRSGRGHQASSKLVRRARRGSGARRARRSDRPAHRGGRQVRHLRALPEERVLGARSAARRASARSASATTRGRHVPRTAQHRRRSASATAAAGTRSSARSRCPADKVEEAKALARSIADELAT